MPHNGLMLGWDTHRERLQLGQGFHVSLEGVGERQGIRPVGIILSADGSSALASSLTGQTQDYIEDLEPGVYLTRAKCRGEQVLQNGEVACPLLLCVLDYSMLQPSASPHVNAAKHAILALAYLLSSHLIFCVQGGLGESESRRLLTDLVLHCAAPIHAHSTDTTTPKLIVAYEDVKPIPGTGGKLHQPHETPSSILKEELLAWAQHVQANFSQSSSSSGGSERLTTQSVMRLFKQVFATHTAVLFPTLPRRKPALLQPQLSHVSHMSTAMSRAASTRLVSQPSVSAGSFIGGQSPINSAQGLSTLQHAAYGAGPTSKDHSLSLERTVSNALSVAADEDLNSILTHNDPASLTPLPTLYQSALESLSTLVQGTLAKSVRGRTLSLSLTKLLVQALLKCIDRTPAEASVPVVSQSGAALGPGSMGDAGAAPASPRPNTASKSRTLRMNQSPQVLGALPSLQEIIAVALGLEGTNTVTACIEQYMNTMAPAIAVRDEAAFQEAHQSALEAVRYTYLERTTHMDGQAAVAGLRDLRQQCEDRFQELLQLMRSRPAPTQPTRGGLTRPRAKGVDAVLDNEGVGRQNRRTTISNLVLPPVQQQQSASTSPVPVTRTTSGEFASRVRQLRTYDGGLLFAGARSSVDQTENLREARPSFAFAPRHEPALSDQLPKLPYSVARASEPGARRQSMVLRPSTLQGALSRSTATTAHSACTSPLPRLDLGVRDDKKSGNDEISLAPRSEQIDALRPTKSRGGLLCKDDDVLRSSPLLESLVASWDGRRVSPGRSSLPSAVTRGISADMPKLQLPTSAPADDAP